MLVRITAVYSRFRYKLLATISTREKDMATSQCSFSNPFSNQQSAQAEAYGGRLEASQLAAKLQTSTKIMLDLVVAVGDKLSSLRQSCHETPKAIEALLASAKAAHFSPWGAPDCDLANQQMNILISEVNRFVNNLDSQIETVTEELNKAAKLGRLSDNLQSFDAMRFNLLKATNSFTAQVSDAVRDGYCPADSRRGAFENPLNASRSGIFKDSDALVTDVTGEVLRVQSELLRSLATEALIEAKLEPPSTELSIECAELEKIASSLGTSSYPPGATSAELLEVDQCRHLRVSLATLKYHAGQLVEELRSPTTVPNLDSHVHTLVTAHGSLGAITAQMPGIFALAAHSNSSIADLALEQIAKFGEQTDLARVDSDLNFGRTSLPEDYRDKAVIQARAAVMTKLKETILSSEAPKRYVTTLQRFGCEGIEAIAKILESSQPQPKALLACLDALRSIPGCFDRDKNALCNKDYSFRAVYSKAYEAAELALKPLSDTEASKDISELSGRVLCGIRDALAELKQLEHRYPCALDTQGTSMDSKSQGLSLPT